MKTITITTSVVLLASVMGTNAEPESKIELMHTLDGIEFGIWGNTNHEQPAPTLIVLATTIKNTLNSAYYRHCGNQLVKRGYICISINLPCHGDQRVDGEPEGLSGWSHRVARDSDFVAEFNNRLSKVLDHLIKQGVSDPRKIAACGTSRGGFLALHAAIHDPRVKCVAGFAPVTDLSVLREFKSTSERRLVKQLNLIKRAKDLAGRKVWIVIGDQDERVGTDHAIQLAREISRESRKQKLPSQATLHVLSEPRGHTIPDGADRLAADWILQQIDPDQ
jgi:dienelactone hydrolase